MQYELLGYQSSTACSSVVATPKLAHLSNSGTPVPLQEKVDISINLNGTGQHVSTFHNHLLLLSVY